MIHTLINHNTTLNNKLSEANEKSSNISGVSKSQKFCPKYIELTDYENSVLAEAIAYMNNNRNKTVLVDIFLREFSTKNSPVVGRININNLDTHTVLLYKTVSNQIMVIYPNNPMFSSHLNKYGDGQIIQTLCSTELKYKIYSRPENSETGFDISKFRDCSDIAAKLSFLLNQDQNYYQTIDEIMNSDAVKLITNNPKIDKMDLPPENLIRLKQSYNIAKIQYCNEQMTIIAQKIIDENKKFDQQTQELQNAHFLALNHITQEKNQLINQLQSTYEMNLSGNNEKQNELL